MFKYQKCKQIKQAKAVLYQKKEKDGHSVEKIIPLQSIVLQDEDDRKKKVIYFEYQKMKYYWDEEKNLFEKVKPFLGVNLNNLIQGKVTFFRSEIHR